MTDGCQPALFRPEPPLDQYTLFLSHEYFRTLGGSPRDNQCATLLQSLCESSFLNIKFQNHFIYTDAKEENGGNNASAGPFYITNWHRAVKGELKQRRRGHDEPLS